MTTAKQSPRTDDAVLRLLRTATDLCRNARRPDLAQTLEVASARIRRPATIICVVGEYKQGKSQVINALIGREICVVDDDLATAAITVIGHGAEPAAVVHRSDDGKRRTEAIDPGDLALFTVETEEGSFPEDVDLVEVAIPSALLKRGMTIVDTPGVNSFRPGNETAVLDFLTYADGLVLVSDASAELSPPELRFLEAARRVCPTVMVALSKIDLYPEWRRIAALNAGHLAALGMSKAIIPISSVLQKEAIANQDHNLHGESGFSGLLEALQKGILNRAQHLAAGRSIEDLRRVLGTIRATEQANLEALESPEAAEQRLSELRRAEAAVARLRSASAKWMVALNDGIGDVRSDVDYRLRSAMRQRIQDTDRKVAEANVKAEWDAMIDGLTESLAEEAGELFVAVREGTDRVAQQIAELIAEDVPALSGGEGDLDVAGLWSSTDRGLTADGPSVVASGLSVLRGGYSGMLMLSMLANVAGIAILGPLSVGAGVVFGAKQFRDERKRQQDRQRQEARTVLRQFLDQVQHEMSTRAQRAIQDAHRTLRDHFVERIRELSATYAHAMRVLEEAAAANEERTTHLAAEARQRITAIDDVLVAAEKAVDQ